MSSPVFPNAFALNTIWDEMSDCFNSDFHWVINFSNNEVGGYLASALKKEHQSGLHFDENGSVAFNEIWSRYTNEVFTVQAQSFNRYDLLRFMCGLQNESMPIINIDDTTKKTLAGKFVEIRESLTKKKQDKKLVGIDLSGTSVNANEQNDITEVIFAILGSKEFCPVFLVKKNKVEQQNVIKKISSCLETSLDVVEYDWHEGLSMLMHLDAIIVKGGLLKQLAHYSDTPTLTIKNTMVSNTGYSYCVNDLVLESELSSVNGDDVISSLDMLLFGKIRKGHSLPQDNLYQVIKDEWGSFLVHLNGTDNNSQNIKSYINRVLMVEMENGKSCDVSKLWIFGLFEKAELSAVLQDEDAKIDQSISSILSMIRNIAEFPLDDAQTKKFFFNLDVLINNNKISGPAEMVRALFRPSVLAVGMQGQQGLRELEVVLLDIKNKLIQAQQLLRRINLSYCHIAGNPQIGSYFHEES
jgi:hypothetical protein